MKLSKRKKNGNNTCNPAYLGLFIQQIFIIYYLSVTTLNIEIYHWIKHTETSDYILWCVIMDFKKSFFKKIRGIISWRFYYLLICMCVYMCMHEYVCVWASYGGQKRASDPLDLELKGYWSYRSYTWHEFGVQTVVLWRVASFLNCWAISPDSYLRHLINYF